MQELYQIGGSLPENAPTYVQRQADRELLNHLLAGDLCYVLNARQMGKSSLLVQTLQRLQGQGVACATIDLSDLGNQQISLEQWYGGVAFKLLNSFDLFDMTWFMDWWQTHQLLSPVQRLGELLDQVVLAQVDQPIVIFIDEIDSVLSFQFPLDDFFALIRSCYNKRATNPLYNRLTFALVGVATPSDLIADPSRTPFNVGYAIDLQPFCLEEAQPLAAGFRDKVPDPVALLAEILHWTGGQPFLTQKVCHLVQTHLVQTHLVQTQRMPPSSPLSSPEELTPEELNPEELPPWVGDLIQTQIIANWEVQDQPVHFKTLRDRLLRNPQRVGRVLGLYEQVLDQGQLAIDGSPDQAQLRLSGLVLQRQNHLQLYNRIYATIFDAAWVEAMFGQMRPYAESLRAWVESEGQDQSRLLRGQALGDALEWATGKSLSAQDYQFLSASQDAALTQAHHQESQSRLEIAQLMREKALLEELAQEQEHRKRTEEQLRWQRLQQRRWVIGIAGALGSMAAFLVGVFWMQLSAETAHNRLNRLSRLSQMYGATNKREEALVQSLTAAKLLRRSFAIDPKTRWQVTLALYQALHRSEPNLPTVFGQDAKSMVSPPQPLVVAASVDRSWLAFADDKRVHLQTFTGESIAQWTLPQVIALQFTDQSLQTLTATGDLHHWSFNTSNTSNTSNNHNSISIAQSQLINLIANKSTSTPPTLHHGQWNLAQDKLAILRSDYGLELFNGVGQLIKQHSLAAMSQGRVVWGGDDRSFVVATDHGNLYQLDHQGNLLRTRQLDNLDLATLGLDPTGQLLTVIESANNNSVHSSQIKSSQIKVWDLATGQAWGILPLMTKIHHLAWHSRGEIFTTLHTNGEINFWYQDYDHLAQLQPHNPPLQWVGFLPSAGTMVAIDGNLQVSQWNFDLEKLWQQGCDLLADSTQSSCASLE